MQPRWKLWQRDGALGLSMERRGNESGNWDQQSAGDHQCALERCRQLCGAGIQCIWISEQLECTAEYFLVAHDSGSTDESDPHGWRHREIYDHGRRHATFELS